VAVDARLLSYTVIVTADVVPGVDVEEANFTDDILVALATVKPHTDEMVGAVCTHNQLKERPVFDATARSGS
jgi:hypothetical protein